jgi:hypothetical protein
MAKLLKATHEGVIEIGDKKLNVAILSDGARIITQSAVFKAFGRTKRGRAKDDIRVLNRPAFMDAKNLQPFIDEGLEGVLNKIDYETLSGNKSDGFNAEILPMMCKVYLDARQNDALLRQQFPLARASEILLISLSKLGIIALVDEATGYQYERERFELQKILRAYISEEILKWQLTFTDDFYREIFRLWNLPFIPKNIKRKPQFIGRLTNTYIYDQLPDGVLEVIKRNIPRTDGGNYKYRFHQNLTEDVGREHLKKQITEVTTLMQISRSKAEFQELFKRKYHEDPQIALELEFTKESQEEVKSDFDMNLELALNYNPKD